MYNCIFSAHCTELVCDNSCPALVETTYLLERNNIRIDSSVFHLSPSTILQASSIIQSCEGKLGLVDVSNKSVDFVSTVDCADALTYCAICRYYKGSRLHCNVYNLKYSQYIELLKKSWSMKSEPEELEYTRIWAQSAKVLIVSNLDYVNFGDFESQTLLNLLQLRSGIQYTTVVVVPSLSLLASTKSSVFFNRLKGILSDAKKVVTLG